VRRGDSLAKIATKFNVGIGDLAQWNRLDIKNYLQPGQKLLIYVNVAAAA
jgi:membrane-bound lytic murein transglycosylase D